MAWDEYAFATKFRDWVVGVVEAHINKLRPLPRYAVVNTINRTTRIATVTYPGESTPVSVLMGAVQPYSTGVTVRIEGPPGARYITDVAGKVFVDVGP